MGVTLANGFAGEGYGVTIGNRSGHKVEGWPGKVGTYQKVAAESDAVILAVKGAAAEEVVKGVAEEISGKTVIDTTNPLSDEPADEGVLKYFTKPDESLMERLQKIAPDANFVKAFNSVGNAQMIHPKYKDGTPTMFICGNNKKAKTDVAGMLEQLGWEVQDLGGVKSARAVEQLCILWCLPGFVNNQWSHAFKMLTR